MSKSALKIEKNIINIDVEVQNQNIAINYHNIRNDVQQYSDNSDYNICNYSKSNISNVKLDLYLNCLLLYC